MSKDQEYDTREMQTARNRLAEVRKAPLADRKEAREAYRAAMADDPDLVAERVVWLLNGSYGYGEHLIARTIVAKPRMNRVAALAHLIAVYEWQCPEDFATKAWHDLTPDQQTAIDQAITRAIESHERSIKESDHA